MALKELKEIRSPDDNPVLAEAAKRDGNGDKIDETYAKQNGYYELMTVGAADNLTPYGENSGVEGTTPFVMQTAGGSSDIGSQAYLKSLRGNSVNFAQLADIPNSSTIQYVSINIEYDSIGKFSTWNGTSNAGFNFFAIPDTFTIPVVDGHKYLIVADVEGETTNNIPILFSYREGITIPANNYTKLTRFSGIVTRTNGTGDVIIAAYVPANVTFTNFKVRMQIFDLTKIFGAGNEPTSVVEFNRLFPKPYYEYNAGELLSCKVNGIKNVGYNQFDEEWGEIQFDSYVISTNFIRVVAGETYTIENYINDVLTTDARRITIIQYDGTKQNIIGRIEKFNGFNDDYVLDINCQYIKIELAVSDLTQSLIGKTCLHLTHDGSKTGYEQYNSQTYTLPNIELRSAGSVYDELKPNGTLNTKIGVVDLGALTWSYDISTGFMYSNQISAPIVLSGVVNAMCERYDCVDADELSIASDKSFTIYNGKVYVKDSAYNDADVFKNAMSNVYLNYELAAPIETQNDNYKFDELMPIDDWGTQEFLYDSNISIPIPQGNDFFYPVDYKAFIDTLGDREDINYDASKIVSQEQLAKITKETVGSLELYPSSSSTVTFQRNQVIYNHKNKCLYITVKATVTGGGRLFVLDNTLNSLLQAHMYYVDYGFIYSVGVQGGSVTSGLIASTSPSETPANKVYFRFPVSNYNNQTIFINCVIPLYRDNRLPQ